jgi:hypothetical protein
MDAISPLRDSEANEVKPGGENAATAIEAIGDYGAISELKADGRLDKLCRHFEELLRERNELLNRGDRNAPSSVASASA